VLFLSIAVASGCSHSFATSEARSFRIATGRELVNPCPLPPSQAQNSHDTEKRSSI
jgi:hypothetical protein